MNNSTVQDNKSNYNKNIWSFIYKYLSLARLTKPAPIFLLVFPAFWSLALNTKKCLDVSFVYIIYLYVAFLLGGILARSAGAVINDIADRKIDKLVKRTQNRMLASNQVGIVGAIIFVILLGGGGLAILFTFNNFTIFLGLIAIVLIIIYPFTKRFTYYPQVFLGITYSLGVLLGQAALEGFFTLETILLYCACICWVIGFDSIYAIQDYKADKEVGVKSMVVLWGNHIQAVVGYLYLFSLILFFMVGILSNVSFLFYIFLVLVMLHFIWQVININVNRDKEAGQIFNYNVHVGLLIWLAFLIG